MLSAISIGALDSRMTPTASRTRSGTDRMCPELAWKMNSAHPAVISAPTTRECVIGIGNWQITHELRDDALQELFVSTEGDEQPPGVLICPHEEFPVVFGVDSVPGRKPGNAQQEHPRAEADDRELRSHGHAAPGPCPGRRLWRKWEQQAERPMDAVGSRLPRRHGLGSLARVFRLRDHLMTPLFPARSSSEFSDTAWHYQPKPPQPPSVPAALARPGRTQAETHKTSVPGQRAAPHTPPSPSA